MEQSGVKSKILWLSIVQGWAILLVVVGHVNGFTYSAIDPNEFYLFSAIVQRFCYAFHMPLFMFASGGLLYFTRLEKGYTTPALYKDKLRRLLVPYLFFTAIAFVLKGFLSAYTKRSSALTLTSFINAIIDPNNGPLSEMWFIGTLMWLMMLYPFYKVVLKYRWSEIILLAMTLVPFLFGVKLEIKGGWFNLAGMLDYGFYFIGGMLFFKYKVYRWFEKSKVFAPVLTVLFVASVLCGVNIKLINAVLGILMSVAWGVWLSEVHPGLFSSFRDYSFQIYLVGIFPQMFIELLVWTKVHNPWLQLPYYVVSCGLAILAAVLVAKYAQKIQVPWIRWCFGLK